MKLKSSFNLIFKDSLCFLSFPRANFSAMYDRDGRRARKKAEFERWHAEQVNSDYVFNLQKQMKAYCISDVKLLKAGYQKFQDKFCQYTEFDPMEICITIASACNCCWREKLLPKHTIAFQPPRGRHGTRTNEPHNNPTSATGDPTADRIHHVGNGRE